MVRWLVYLALALQTLAQDRVCDPTIEDNPDPENQFLKPPRGCNPGNYDGINSYNLGTSMSIEWQTNYTDVTLQMVQEGNSDPNTIRPLRSMCLSLRFDQFHCR